MLAPNKIRFDMFGNKISSGKKINKIFINEENS